VALAFGAAAVVKTQAKAAVSVGGFGVHVPETESNGRLSDVAGIAARILGAGGDLEILSKEELPTGDLFNRAKLCAIFVLDGIDIEFVDSISDKIPELAKMVRPSKGLVNIQGVDEQQEYVALGVEPKLTKAFSVGPYSLKSLLASKFPKPIVISASLNKHVADSVMPDFAHTGQGTTVDEELDLFGATLAKNLDGDTTKDESPDVIVLTLSSLRAMVTDGNQEGVEKGLVRLNSELPRIVQKLNQKYNNRVATMTVVMGSFMPTTESVSHRSLLDAAPNKTTIAQLSKATDEIADFILMLWIPIILALLLVIIFLCVPWSTELDPLLYSSLGRGDTKRD